MNGSRTGVGRFRGDGPSHRVPRRFVWALCGSAALHALFVCGLPVRALDARVLPVATVSARLVAAPDPEPAAELDSPQTKLPELAARVPSGPMSPPRSAERQDRPTVARAARTTVGPSAASSAPTRDSPPSVTPSEVSLPIPRDPTWYPAKQLDALPRALAPIRPVYPETAAEPWATGRVLVLLLIDEHGIVSEASVVEADPQGYFEESALAAVQSARFAPGSKAGRVVKSRVVMELTYAPRHAAADR